MEASMVTLGRFYEAIEILREYWPEMPIQTVATFMAVATEEDQSITQHELQLKVGLAQSTMSKNVAYLCEFRKLNVKGVGFVEQFPDPADRRHRRVRLTKLGKRVAARVADCF